MRRHPILKQLVKWQAIFLLSMALFIPVSGVFAEKFSMKDGSIVEGEILEEDGRSFFVQTESGIANLPKSEIKEALQDDGQPRNFEVHILQKEAPSQPAGHSAPAAVEDQAMSASASASASAARRPTDSVGILKSVWFRSIIFFIVLALALTQIRRLRPK